MNLPTPTFDTSEYELHRNEDGTIYRIEGKTETAEPDHQYNIDFHAQIVANSIAQMEKVEAFEAENPWVAPEVEEEVIEA